MWKSFYLAAVEESDDAVGLPRLLFVVGHHHYRAPLLAVEPVQELHHFGSHVGVEIARRFVGKYDFRIPGYGSSNCHTLALPARKLRGALSII